MPTTTAPTSGNYIQVNGAYYTQAEISAAGGVQNILSGSTNTSAGTSADGSQLSALGIAHSVLDPLGLSALADWYVGTYQQTGSWDYGNLELPSQPAFQQRFPAYQTLASKGDAITAADYVNFEQTVAQLGQQYGVPSGFFTPDRIASALENNQSTAEIQAGLSRAAQIVADPDIQAWMNANPADGGLGGHQLTPGEIYAQQTDPAFGEQAAADRFTQAQIGGAALSQGTNINGQTAAQLQQAGVTQAQAQSGFNQIGQQSQLYGALPGDNGEKNLDQATQIGAQFGTDATDALAVQQRTAQRKAVFQQGGSLATGNGGYQGAGTSTAA